MKIDNLIILIISLIIISITPSECWSQISISEGLTITENFNNIGGNANATLPSGWKTDKLTTVRTVGTYSSASTSTTVTGGNSMSTTSGNGIYNFGAGPAATAIDRAIGGLSSSSASKSVNLYSFLVNSGSQNIIQLTISYKIEKYRHGSNASGFSIQMYYSQDGNNWTNAGPNFLKSFFADTDNVGYTNAPGDSSVVSQSLLMPMTPGDSIYFAWNYSVSSGTTTSNAQALGIDDISISASSISTIVESPIFSPPGGNYYNLQNVVINTTTPGASIYYTTDGSIPTQSSSLYSAPIPINSSTTLKAKAFKVGMTESSISTVFYRFPIDVSNISALREGVADGITLYRLTSEAVVTYQRPDNFRNQMFIRDATAAIVVDDLALTITNDFNIGDGVTGLTGTLTLFNSLLEFVPTIDPGNATSMGNDVTPESKTLSSLTNADQAKLVSIPFVSFSTNGTFAANTNYSISDASNSGTLRTQFGEADYLLGGIPTTPQNIVALVGQSSTVIHITPRFLADFVPAAPTWTNGWPIAGPPTTSDFYIRVNLNVVGNAYYVVLPEEAPPPNSLQVKNGLDSTGTQVPENLSGLIVCSTAGTEFIDNIFNVTPGATYNVYFVAEAYGVLQASPIVRTISIPLGNTITLSSPYGTDNQSICINNQIINITYTTTSANGASFLGLPAGVTGIWSDNIVTITGTPIISGNYNYNVIATGGFGDIIVSGNINVIENNTINLISGGSSDNQSICINYPLTTITYTTTGATGAFFSGLPAGVTGTWAANVATITGTSSVSGTFNYTIHLTGGCGSVTATGSINVYPNNTIALSSAVGSDSQTLCINTSLNDILYATTSATGANFLGLPIGVTGSWAANVATISGTPSISGLFNYTIVLTGGCGNTNITGQIHSIPGNVIALFSPSGTDVQNCCTSAPITPLIYHTFGATGANFSGLPNGITGNWASDVITISGTPTELGVFDFTITLTGGCGNTITTGTLTVAQGNTIELSSGTGTDNQSICINNPINAINYITTRATNAEFTGLPIGVIGIWDENVVTISGTPLVSGIFNYTVTLIGGCGISTATGTLLVHPANTFSLISSPGTDNQTICFNAPIANIIYSYTGATGANISGLPEGINGFVGDNEITLTGTSLQSGLFSYTISLTGGCISDNISGTINVNPEQTISLTSAIGSANQTVCNNSNLSEITFHYTGISSLVVTGLPAGVHATNTSDTIKISGAPSSPGNYIYNLTFSNGCGESYYGYIDVNPIPVPSVYTNSPVCSGNEIGLLASPNGMLSYHWTGPSGFLSTLQNPTIPNALSANSGMYSLMVTDTNGCSTSTSALVEVNPVSVGGSINGGGTIYEGISTVNLQLIGYSGNILYWQKQLNQGDWTTIPLTSSTHTETPNGVGTWKYRALVQNNGCQAVYSSEAIVNVIYRTLLIKVYLEGLYDESIGQMNKAQNESGNAFPGLIADMVTVCLGKNSPPYSYEYVITDIGLPRNGIFTINLPSGSTSSYYLVVKHRNSIETWSSYPVSLHAGQTTYNFTNGAQKAYGYNLNQVGSVWVIYGGDVDQDGIVDSSDMIPTENQTSSFSMGYLPEDVNGDGLIDSSDMILIENNVSEFVTKVVPF